MTTTMTSRPLATHDAPARMPATRNTFFGVVQSECIKLMSLRSIRFTLILSFLVGVGIMTLGAIVMSTYADELVGDAGSVSYLMQTLQPPIMFLSLLFGVLGVFALSSEYSSGMILSTLSATPKRARVFLAKLVVVSLIALAAALVTIGAGQGLALAIHPSAVAGLTDPQYLTAALGSLLFLVAMTIMSFGVAGILRSTAGGIAVMAVLTFVLPIAFSFASMANQAWIDWIMNHLPLMLGNLLASGVTEVPDEWSGSVLTWGESLVSMGVWALIFVIPAFILFMKRDAK